MHDREMRHVDWRQVYERQRLRSREVETWLDALDLTPHTCLLDLGSGPGFATLRAAVRIGPEGRVIAVDRRAEALAFLREEAERLKATTPMAAIETVATDAEELALSDRVDAALLTHVLHHTEAPQRVISALARALAPGGRAVVAEYDPDAPGEVGPPLAVRIPPTALEEWLRAAGFVVVRRLPDGREQYAFLVQRP